MPISSDNYLEQNNVILSGSITTTVTFTDESIKSNSKLNLQCSEDIEYDTVNISNGTCSFVFPAQGSNKTVNFRLYVSSPQYYRILKKVTTATGNATAARVRSGKTFSNASGIGLTGTGAGGPYRHVGETVTCDLSGSTTNNNYQCDVVYIDSAQMCLLGNSYVASGDWSTACGYTWTATFAAGQVSDTSKTISNVKIPTLDQIIQYCNGREYRTGRFYSSGYRTSTEGSSSNAYYVYNTGGIYNVTKNNAWGIVPYIVIPL